MPLRSVTSARTVAIRQFGRTRRGGQCGLAVGRGRRGGPKSRGCVSASVVAPALGPDPRTRGGAYRLWRLDLDIDFAALPGWRAAQWVDDRVGSADLVVIDAPPHAETEARIAVRAARLVVVPVQPSPLDLWATAEMLKMAQDERRRSVVVLNRVPPRSRLTEDIATDLAGAGMALGLGVIENARMTSAAAEISALAEEIRGALSGKPVAWQVELLDRQSSLCARSRKTLARKSSGIGPSLISGLSGRRGF